MSFQPGDRVRWETTGDDGLPLVRYGFIGSLGAFDGHATVMLDGDLKGNLVLPVDDLAIVSITTVELRLSGSDLLIDPAMRHGLVHLWSAEADDAGLDVGAVEYLACDLAELNGTPVPLAEVSSGGQQYLLQASQHPPTDIIHVRAQQAGRSSGF